MTTNGYFPQTPPDKANELFEKLLATSNTALKTRERLFADLKEELVLLAGLQEEHLFPVLTRHGMHDLLREAINDNEETAALLGELERMPKNSAEFISRVTELRRAFQQHIRDDRMELLPAVLKVLSDEEVHAVTERVEDEMANFDDTKRAEARHARDQAEAVQRVTEDVADTLRAGVESTQTIVQAMQEAVETSFGAFSKLTRRSTDEGSQLAGRSDVVALGLSEEAAHNLRAVAQSAAALARGLQDVSREAVERSQKRLQRNLDGLQALARCRSMTDLVEVQTSLVRDNLEQTVENSRRIAELMIQMADAAARTVTVQADKTAQRLSRVA
ncbi:phasin family protein [Microvirga sp. VF16]|uniref:phasin family protein n=1 Tax=Microvirga sp. VF16 TaxID=2807101 RepID=UPI00193E81E5|nr:phasin family protein [Microvirga sp. VF16]QRM27369.1 phasin family protein [Microvirga sp. VF16]